MELRSPIGQVQLRVVQLSSATLTYREHQSLKRGFLSSASLKVAMMFI
jgi:hypothetical protein